MHTCIHAYMHTCITCIHAYTLHAYMHTLHTWIHCIHAYSAYMHTLHTLHTLHTCIHAYMHTCIHAYMHTYMCVCSYAGVQICTTYDAPFHYLISEILFPGVKLNRQHCAENFSGRLHPLVLGDHRKIRLRLLHRRNSLDLYTRGMCVNIQVD